MTSGQGGPPPGWGPEQGSPPPYGNPGPPYGSPPPYGPPPGQQWPGYTPMPPLPQPIYGGPVPTERPLTVRVGLGSFVGSLVLSAIGAVVTFMNLDLILADAIAQLKPQPGVSAEAARSSAELFARAGGILGIVVIGVYGLFVWFAWRGRNWARIVLWCLGGFGLIGALISVTGRGSPVPFLTGISAFQGLLLLTAVVALALKPSNDWFRYQGWLRATGQR
ncbi:MAG: hypothetical protein QOJ68_3675 [Blastococcus sp.]|jgi:hypothetical protein|nr:hypothetical protein [Blastococcus sp.]